MPHLRTRFGAAVAAVCFVPSAALAADLLDIRVGVIDSAARVEIFTSAPFPLTPASEAEAAEGRAFRAPGLQAQPLRLALEPWAAPLTQIEVRPAEGGALIVVTGAAAWDAGLSIRGGGTGPAVSVIDLMTDGASNLAAAEAAPAQAPTQTAMQSASEPSSTAPQMQATAAPTPLGADQEGQAAPLVAPPGADAQAVSAEAAETPAAPRQALSVFEASSKVIEADLSEAACETARADVEEDAWNMEALVDFGLCLASDGDVEGAETIFQRLLTFDPYSYRAHLGLAAIAHSSGDFAGARKAYQAALESEPPEEIAPKIRSALVEISS